jgi:membrane fusion protein (multidrug efflux system)
MARPATAKQVIDAPSAEAAPPPLPGRRRSGLLRPRNLIIAAVALVALLFGAIEVHQRLTHVYEYDARVTADLVTISSRVSGWLVSRDVEEGDRVRKGDPIATVDRRASELRVKALEAQLRGLDAERERLLAQRRMVEEQVGARSRSRQSAVSASTAAHAALRAEVALARSELDRAETLYARRIISSREVDRARAELQRLQSDLQKREAEIQEARGTAQEAQAEMARLAVIDSELDMLAAEVGKLQAELAQQMVDLDDRTIRSPIDGVVDRTFVEGGEYVGAGQRIALVHDPSQVWVEANIKETQVRRLKVGQPVEITVDAYPDRVFTGRVERIGNSTTSNFALLPTPNPSGNFTKITQRIPVRIAIDPTDMPLSPGMMVEVNVDVRDR